MDVNLGKVGKKGFRYDVSVLEITSVGDRSSEDKDVGSGGPLPLLFF